MAIRMSDACLWLLIAVFIPAAAEQQSNLVCSQTPKFVKAGIREGAAITCRLVNFNYTNSTYVIWSFVSPSPAGDKVVVLRDGQQKSYYEAIHSNQFPTLDIGRITADTLRYRSYNVTVIQDDLQVFKSEFILEVYGEETTSNSPTLTSSGVYTTSSPSSQSLTRTSSGFLTTTALVTEYQQATTDNDTGIIPSTAGDNLLPMATVPQTSPASPIVPSTDAIMTEPTIQQTKAPTFFTNYRTAGADFAAQSSSGILANPPGRTPPPLTIVDNSSTDVLSFQCNQFPSAVTVGVGKDVAITCRLNAAKWTNESYVSWTFNARSPKYGYRNVTLNDGERMYAAEAIKNVKFPTLFMSRVTEDLLAFPDLKVTFHNGTSEVLSTVYTTRFEGSTATGVSVTETGASVTTTAASISATAASVTATNASSLSAPTTDSASATSTPVLPQNSPVTSSIPRVTTESLPIITKLFILPTSSSSTRQLPNTKASTASPNSPTVRSSSESVVRTTIAAATVSRLTTSWPRTSLTSGKLTNLTLSSLPHRETVDSGSLQTVTNTAAPTVVTAAVTQRTETENSSVAMPTSMSSEGRPQGELPKVSTLTAAPALIVTLPSLSSAQSFSTSKAYTPVNSGVTFTPPSGVEPFTSSAAIPTVSTYVTQTTFSSSLMPSATLNLTPIVATNNFLGSSIIATQETLVKSSTTAYSVTSQDSRTGNASREMTSGTMSVLISASNVPAASSASASSSLPTSPSVVNASQNAQAPTASDNTTLTVSVLPVESVSIVMPTKDPSSAPISQKPSAIEIQPTPGTILSTMRQTTRGSTETGASVTATGASVSATGASVSATGASVSATAASISAIAASVTATNASSLSAPTTDSDSPTSTSVLPQNSSVTSSTRSVTTESLPNTTKLFILATSSSSARQLLSTEAGTASPNSPTARSSSESAVRTTIADVTLSPLTTSWPRTSLTREKLTSVTLSSLPHRETVDGGSLQTITNSAAPTVVTAAVTQRTETGNSSVAMPTSMSSEGRPQATQETLVKSSTTAYSVTSQESRTGNASREMTSDTMSVLISASNVPAASSASAPSSLPTSPSAVSASQNAQTPTASDSVTLTVSVLPGDSVSVVLPTKDPSSAATSQKRSTIEAQSTGTVLSTLRQTTRGITSPRGDHASGASSCFLSHVLLVISLLAVL